MKKWFAITAIFLMTYVGFLVATLPANLVVNSIALPKGINLQGVSGTIWQAKIQQFSSAQINVQKIQAELSFWSLLTLKPSVALVFGDPLLPGPEGKATISGNTEHVSLTDVDILVTANSIAQQLTLAVPATAQGGVRLTLTELSMTNLSAKNLVCQQATGHIHWSNAGVIALDNNIKLGEFNGKISCLKNELIAVLSPKNNLGLTATVYLKKTARVTGSGYLKPGKKFPQQLKSVLPFIGQADKDGRYSLAF